jgi:hypothetical protein
MDENTRQKVGSYVELLDAVKAKTGSEQTAVAVLVEVAKDQRTERMREEREAKTDEPATERQRKFMDKLGIKYPKTISKQEASAVIDEELGKSG